VTPAQASTVVPAITKNDYALELFQGPVLAPSRVTALAGAYTAYAEGVEGVATNAAAPAVREIYSTDWWTLDISPSVSLPGGYAGTDFDNRGNSNPDLVSKTNHFLFASLGARVQAGSLGVAVTGELLRYDVTDPKPNAPGLALAYGRYHAVVAYGFWNNQVVLGGGLRAVTLALSQSNGDITGVVTDKLILTQTGASPEVGAIIKPNDSPYRVGATFRAPVETGLFSTGNTPDSSSGVTSANGYILPRAVVQPWELEAGFAWQIGPRPLNPVWENPHEEEVAAKERVAALRRQRADAIAIAPTREERRKLFEADRVEREQEDRDLANESARLLAIRKARYANWPREKLLVLGSVLMTGASHEAVALEGFLDQKREIVGRNVVFTPRAGVEAEPIENRARVRLGGYIEPTRFDGGSVRQHFTFGGDIKLFNFDVLGFFPNPWQLQFILDAAPRYANYGIGIGAWH